MRVYDIYVYALFKYQENGYRVILKVFLNVKYTLLFKRKIDLKL